MTPLVVSPPLRVCPTPGPAFRFGRAVTAVRLSFRPFVDSLRLFLQWMPEIGWAWSGVRWSLFFYKTVSAFSSLLLSLSSSLLSLSPALPFQLHRVRKEPHTPLLFRPSHPRSTSLFMPLLAPKVRSYLPLPSPPLLRSRCPGFFFWM